MIHMQYSKSLSDLELYLSDEMVMEREYGKAPNGNLFGGMWVLRKIRNGGYVDHDQYRTDLSARNNLCLGPA